MYNRIGFIGAGNMGGALIGGAIKSGFLSAQNIFVSDADASKSKFMADKYGVKAVHSNLELVESCEVLIIAVKPHIYGFVLDEIKDFVRKDMLIITIAAGVAISYVKSFFKQDIKVIRTMPNTPALVGEGMTAITYAPPVEESDVSFVKDLFSSFGIVETLKEEQIDAFTALCSSSPAFVGMFIEAMADAGVLLGLPRNESYIMAAQAIRGSVKMIIEGGKHPAQLKDMVCSPSGNTIEGVRKLEEKGMRSAVMEAVIVAAEKAKLIGEKYK